MGRNRWSDRFMVEDCTTLSAFDKKWKPELRFGSVSLTIDHPNRGSCIQTIHTISTQVKPRGARCWFICPGCQKRVGKLYIPPGESYFKCRNCYNLTYKSQKERYGATENFWTKLLMEKLYFKDTERARRAYSNI